MPKTNIEQIKLNNINYPIQNQIMNHAPQGFKVIGTLFGTKTFIKKNVFKYNGFSFYCFKLNKQYVLRILRNTKEEF